MPDQQPWDEQIPGQPRKNPLALNLPSLLGSLASLRAGTPPPPPDPTPAPLADLMRNPRNLFGVTPSASPTSTPDAAQPALAVKPQPTPLGAPPPTSTPDAAPLATAMRPGTFGTGEGNLSLANQPLATPQTRPDNPVPQSTGPLADFMMQNQRPELHGWKKGLDVAGEILAPRLEQAIPGTEGNYQRKYGLAVRQQGDFDKTQETQAKIDQERSKAIQERAAAEKALRPAPYKAESLTQQESDAVDELVAGGMSRVDAIQKITDATDKSKPQKLTNPYEGFAYGTPQEKQAAQDFIRFEKKTGRQYDKPGEIEQRYSLYQRDPEAYKAMFGDRGAAQDQSNATRMLNYFDKRRKEISGDWTLDETEKAKQLSELDQLAQPYLDAAGPGQGGDRITVIHPNGTKGTIPRSQLKGAQKKGYKLAQ